MDDVKKVIICYHGLTREGSGWRHAYAVGDDLETVEKMVEPNTLFERKIRASLQVGVVYELDGSHDDGALNYTRHSNIFVGRAENADVIQAVASANTLVKAAEGAAKESWLISLEPARQAYKAARGTGKNMVLAQVVRFVTKGN